MQLKFLKANNGDSIIIKFKDEEGKARNILIDGGTARTYGRGRSMKPLKKEVYSIQNDEENIDLLIITHIDDDHIMGIKKMLDDKKFNKKLIKRIWFNSGNAISNHFATEIDPKRMVEIPQSNGTETSIKKAIHIEEIIENLGLKNNVIFNGHEEILYIAKLTVITPNIETLTKLNKDWQTEKQRTETSFVTDYDKTFDELISNDPNSEDKSLTNCSSISFILELEGKRVLFTGDAHSDELLAGLKEYSAKNNDKLKFDLVKLPHHGSANNYLQSLANTISCDKYVICSNGLSHGNPNKLTIARILNSKNQNPTFYFNYPIKSKVLSTHESNDCYQTIELAEDGSLEL